MLPGKVSPVLKKQERLNKRMRRKPRTTDEASEH